ncbi:lactonase family protein [Streptomyces sp. 049-1]|uniref:lactonase family protein n=1 Tax=Streptomyces sp. 049-1 TaxID=2789264 RepID=UPI0039806486
MSRITGRRHRTFATALFAATSAVAAVLTVTPSAGAAPSERHDPEQKAVFEQTNDPSGNTVIAFARDRHGHLHEAGRYATGGVGATLDQAPIDPLASQGSLTHDPAHQLLYAVNAGSDTVTVFEVRGARLHRLQIVSSHGRLPVSVGVAKDRVYILDAGGDGTITGYQVRGRHLVAVPRSTRSLALGNADAPYFLSAPSDVVITPDGTKVIVATKSHNTLQTFRLDHRGAPAAKAVITPSAGVTPFALAFDRRGNLLVTEAPGTQSSYKVESDGSLTTVSAAVPNNGQQASCWAAVAGNHVYVSNAGSGTITAYRIAHNGALSLKDSSGITAKTDTGPVDLAISGDQRFLYQEANGAGAIDEFTIGVDGSLTRIGTVTGLPVFDGSKGPEGLAAT